MNGWIDFWVALLVVTLVIYALMVIYVSIGGFRDIKRMFRTLSDNRQNKHMPEDDAHSN